MLVLTRQVGERIQIGDRITLEVVSIKGNRVRLGIGAPAGVNILREELQEIEVDLDGLQSSETLAG